MTGGIEMCEEKEFTYPIYDGNDISRECADVIKTEDYIELDDYLIYLQENKLVRVSKGTGEEKDIAEDIALDFKYNVCAWRDRVYFADYANGAECICSINVQTLEKEKIECIGKRAERTTDRKLQANDKYLLYSSFVENKRRIVCYDLKNKTTTLLSLLHPVNKYEMEESNFYLAGSDLYFKVLFSGVYKYNLLSKEMVCIQENLDISESSFLNDEVKCHEGILYSIDTLGIQSNRLVYFIDLENPLSLQRVKLPGNKDTEYHFCNGKVYYVTADAESEFGYYDIKTKRHTVIMKNCPLVGSHQDGGKWVYVQPHGQIVGKWFYGNLGPDVVDIFSGEID